MRFALFCLCILCWLLASERPTSAQTNAVYRKVFNGITAATVSAPITNQSQTMHLVYVFFPGQTTTQTGLQVRLEASYDNVTYWPISADITQAANVGGQVYAVATAFGSWPFIRMRSATVAPSAMTVWYAGHPIPTVGLIESESDRFLL